MSLHVPSLDTDLFSTTKHGRRGKGNAFLLADGGMHLTFPTFTLERTIPDDCDLTIDTEPLTAQDWAVPNYLCDGGTDANCDLENFAERLAFVNRVFNARHAGRPMTRSQRRKRSQEKNRNPKVNHTQC